MADWWLYNIEDLAVHPQTSWPSWEDMKPEIVQLRSPESWLVLTRSDAGYYCVYAADSVGTYLFGISPYGSIP